MCTCVTTDWIIIAVLSAMIRGAHNGTTFVVKDYKIEEVDNILKEFLSSL